MADLKTKATGKSVKKFIESVEDEGKRADCFELVKIMEEITGAKATMWGDSIVGFGLYDYVYASGHSGSWPRAGFSPRKANLTIYIMAGFSKYADLMKKIGKHKHSKSCLYVKRLSDLNLKILKKLIKESLKEMEKRYPKKS